MTPRTRSALVVLATTLAVSVTGLVAPADARPAVPDHREARGQLARPLVFGHRGAAGYRPEHTMGGYRLAIRQGADYIEPDLVSTKDGKLVDRHENNITETTDVADHPEFAARRTTKSIDGVSLTGWFTEDFTLAELRTLRAVERLPDVRPENTRYDGQFRIPTFDQVLRLVRRASARTGRTIGVAPETKHPTYFDSIGLSLEEPMLADLAQHRLARRGSKVLIQSFETSNLRELNRHTDLPLEQLVDSVGGPFDLAAEGTTYTDLISRRGLRRVASYADWVGPNKDLVLPRDATGAVGQPSALVAKAHAVGLKVVVFTIRAENQFLATTFQKGTDPDARGDVGAEIVALLDAGVDALFADQPKIAVQARNTWLAHHN